MRLTRFYKLPFEEFNLIEKQGFVLCPKRKREVLTNMIRGKQKSVSMVIIFQRIFEQNNKMIFFNQPIRI